jgi:hypothetical protein
LGGFALIHIPISLVGDGIENPGNAQAMMDAAGMFGTSCLFRDRYALAASWEDQDRPPILVTYDTLRKEYSPLVAFDNLPGAADVYGFHLPRPPGSMPAVVMGNERHGIGHDIQSIAHHKVQIPMFARPGSVNCLNVAAASAVALYYLSRGGGPGLHTAQHPGKRRPELMLVGGASHVELGSTIRSAGVFGWERVLLDDSYGVWFGAGRSISAEGRAAARRHRNPIRLLPITRNRGSGSGHYDRYAFSEICVVWTSPTPGSVPLHKANLSRGPQQLLVIPDEGGMDVEAIDWQQLGKTVNFVHLDLPSHEYAYRYRLAATIVLAEAARQVGKKAHIPSGRRTPGEPFYDSALALMAEAAGETVYLQDLEAY